MFLCRSFRIDQQFFIVFSFFLLSSFAFAEFYIRFEKEGVTSSTVEFQYKGVMDFNKLQEKEFASPRLDFDTEAFVPLQGKPVQVIGAAYQNSFTVVKNTDSNGGSEKVGKHITMPNNTWVVPMVAGTRGNNYFGCYFGGMHSSNRIDIISSNKVVYSLRGNDFYRGFPGVKNVFADGESDLPHVFVNFWCMDCQIQRIIFYTGSGHPFHTDHHTIGWATGEKKKEESPRKNLRKNIRQNSERATGKKKNEDSRRKNNPKNTKSKPVTTTTTTATPTTTTATPTTTTFTSTTTPEGCNTGSTTTTSTTTTSTFIYYE